MRSCQHKRVVVSILAGGGVHLEGSSLVWTFMLSQFLAMGLTDVHCHLTPRSACAPIGWAHMLAPMGGASLTNLWLTLMHLPTTPSIATACNLLHEMKVKTLNELLNGGVWNFFSMANRAHSSQVINPFLFYTVGFSRCLQYGLQSSQRKCLQQKTDPYPRGVHKSFKVSCLSLNIALCILSNFMACFFLLKKFLIHRRAEATRRQRGNFVHLNKGLYSVG